MSSTGSRIDIIPVTTKSLLKTYLDFIHDLYKDDENYVPELYMSQKDLFNKKKNPFFEYAEIQSFIAKRAGKVVGRITAILNKNYNDYHKCNVGFFGFYDVIDDYEVSKTLLDTALEWNRTKGVDAVLGPTNFSTNDTAGILIEGS